MGVEEVGVSVEDEGVKVGGGQLLVVGWMVYYICVLRLERGFLVRSKRVGYAHCSR